jgi:hypothetical protein
VVADLNNVVAGDKEMKRMLRGDDPGLFQRDGTNGVSLGRGQLRDELLTPSIRVVRVEVPVWIVWPRSERNARPRSAPRDALKRLHVVGAITGCNRPDDADDDLAAQHPVAQ